jgi:hypothetical protein
MSGFRPPKVTGPPVNIRDVVFEKSSCFLSQSILSMQRRQHRSSLNKRENNQLMSTKQLHLPGITSIFSVFSNSPKVGAQYDAMVR